MADRVVGVGIDVVDVPRLAVALARTPRLSTRLFTDDEIAYCTAKRNSTERFAVRFAAKEATMKALGVGLGAVDWRSIEVVRSASGEPGLVLHAGAGELALAHGARSWKVSLSHTALSAHAFVVLLGD